MAKHEKFNFKSLADLKAKVTELKVDIEFDDDLSPLKQAVEIGSFRLPNSLGIHPMEGCDGTADGAPTDLTVRRYDRYATGGAGLLWFEATAVVPAGRANPRQLWMQNSNIADYARLLERCRKTAVRQFGQNHNVFTVIQLTHSGRSSRPEGKPAPVIAWHNPYVDPLQGIPADYPTITDSELESLEDDFVKAARLAWQAGFNAVDIKAAHGYLSPELLTARTRPGRYGGSFENRTRFLLNIVRKVREGVPGIMLAVRLAAFDGVPHPYGWGTNKNDPTKEDLEEPIRLAHLLYDNGVQLLSVSAGVGRYKPHFMRPFDKPDKGTLPPDEHPLESVARLFRMARSMQQAVPQMVVMDVGYSWLRHYFPFAAAANLRRGSTQIVGLGRQSFAYPDFPKDIFEKGMLDPKKACISCDYCVQLMRGNTKTGCVTRDSAIYLPLYRELSRQ